MSGRIGHRAFNISLRAVTLCAKFFLVFSLARFLEPGEVGLYGLVFATIAYVQFALGLDFYTFANRELIAAPPDRWTELLRDQGIFYLLAYAVVLPLCLPVFALGLIPWNVAPWFLLLLVLEHVAHELGRTLVATSHPVLATVVLFLRAGAWVLVLVPVMWLFPAARHLQWVFFAWSIGAGLACALGFRMVARIGRWHWRRAVDWRWLRRGVGVAAPLLVATLALKGLSTFDRYWAGAIGGLESLAAYVLFVGIANAVKTFLEAGVFVFVYPSLIRSARRGQEAAFRAAFRSLARQTAVVSLGVSGAALLLVRPLLRWIGRPLYEQHITLLYWCLGAVLLYAAGMVFHYAVYAQHKDGAIIRSHLAGLAVFMVSVSVLRGSLGIVAVPISMCVAHGLILVWKIWTFVRIRPATGKVAVPEHP